MADQILSNNPVPPERIPCIREEPPPNVPVDSEAIKKRINENLELILASADSELLSSLDIVLLQLVRAQGFGITEDGRKHLEGGAA